MLTDLARFVDEDAGIDRTLSGHPLSFYRFAGTSSEVIDDDPVASFYGPYEYVISGTGRTLGDLQQIVRVHGVLILLGVVLALAGLIRGPRQVRMAILILAGPAMTLLVASVALATYDGRFGVPAMPGLISAGLVGAWSLAREPAVVRRPCA